jgi:uncharacterized SAM-binding protein YcdF (DUF218 family)
MRHRLGILVQAGLRGFALFLGGFTLMNLAGGLMHADFDANIWWIDLGRLQGWAEKVVLLLMALAMLVFALMREPRKKVCMGCAVVVGSACAVCAFNTMSYVGLLTNGHLHSGLLLPFSLVLAVLLGACTVSALRCNDVQAATYPRWPVAAMAMLIALAFPFAQMFFYGKTDYRRSVDVIVVFGARAYADGRCSDALADRVRTACLLYREGYAPRLLLSGGPGDGEVHETEAMRRLALRLGVPDQAILCDEQGLNSRATVRETVALMRENGWQRVLAVSHDYHLPRVKMAFHRAGQDVYTVPARERYLLTQIPYLMAREVAAFWVYYAAPAVPPGESSS